MANGETKHCDSHGREVATHLELIYISASAFNAQNFTTPIKMLCHYIHMEWEKSQHRDAEDEVEKVKIIPVQDHYILLYLLHEVFAHCSSFDLFFHCQLDPLKTAD